MQDQGVNEKSRNNVRITAKLVEQGFYHNFQHLLLWKLVQMYLNFCSKIGDIFQHATRDTNQFNQNDLQP